MLKLREHGIHFSLAQSALPNRNFVDETIEIATCSRPMPTDNKATKSRRGTRDRKVVLGHLLPI